MQPTENYAQTPEGLLYVADGFNPLQRWDGLQAALVPVGVYAPATAPTIAASGSGTATGTYYAYVRFLNDRGSWSDLSPISNAVTAANQVINYTAVPVPTQANVVRRQILRNTAGQTDTFYVDVDTTNLVATSFTSSLSDA